jgi:tRNA U34 5-carboxymethylaminomethyl modifying enzyme MnmG/GidA
MANNPYLMVRSRSEYYTSMSVSGLPTFLISVKNMNLLSSSRYKHLKTHLIKHKQNCPIIRTATVKTRNQSWRKSSVGPIN